MLLSFTLFILVLSDSSEVSGQEEMREKLKEMFPYCRIGEDEYGAGVYFAPFAAWQVGDSATNGTAEEMEVYNLIIEKLIRVLSADGGKKRKGPTWIFEYAGVDIASMLAPGTTQISMKIFSKNKELAKVVGKLYFINVPLPPELFGIMWNSLFAELWSRTQVFGVDREEWEPQLRRSIPNNVLLKGYGGTNPVPERCDRKEIRRKFKLFTAESAASLIKQNPVALGRSVSSLAGGNVYSRASSLFGGALD